MSWVEIYESLTPYELAVQRAMEVADPWGPARDDQRAAWNTSAIIRSASSKDLTESEIEGIVNFLEYFVWIKLFRKDEK